MKNHTSRVIYGNSRPEPARVVGLLGLLLVALLSPVPPLLGQTGQGTLTGTITDASRAIVPAATVALTNIDTGVSVKTESSDVGIYYFGAVPIGHYKVTVTKQGFKEWEGTFTLAVGQNALVDPALQVGSTATVVEVKAAAAPLEVTNGTVADVKESNQIRDLPLDGRQIGNLFNVVPGVESGAGGARVNGMKVGSLDINLDGVTLVDRFGGGMVRVQPGIETIQEFRVETVGSEARFDQPATVIMASRSGTNQLHGGGYEYIRDNTVLGATRLRTDPVGSGFVLPELIRNEFGAYAGGPVVIPHLYNGKNKSFWFFDYEGLRDRERGSVEQPWVPTTAMWGGDLSNAVDLNNPCSGPTCPSGFAPITIYDPTSTNPTTFERTPFPNNQIPGPYSPTALALQSLTELPCCGAFALDNPYIAPNVTNTYPYIQTLNNYTAKWDENISDKDRLSVRYTRSISTAAQEGGYYANPINPSSGMGSSARNYFNTNVAVNYNRTISPNWLNELLIGVLRDPNHIGTLADFTDWSAKLDTPNPFGVTGWPTLYTYETSLGSPAYFGWDSDNNHKQHLTSETIEDNVTWTHGKHTVQFGFRGRKEQNNIEELQQAQGSHSWDPAYTTDWSQAAFGPAPDTGSGFAELLLGTPDYLSDQYNRGFFYFRQTEVGLYASDKIKVKPRLTLSLGLRWDKWTPYSEARNRLDVPYEPEQTFEAITPGSINMNSLGTPPAVLTSWSNLGLAYATANSVGYPSALFRPINHDFAPRLGIAYQIWHNTVIRGSYGIYYVAMPLSLILQSTRDNPPLNLRFQNIAEMNPNVIGGVNGPYYGLYPYITSPAPGDYMPPNTVNITQSQTEFMQLYGNGATYWDGKNWNDERQQTWNVTVEHELPGHIGARLSYIGTYGGNLEQQFAIDDEEPYYSYALRTGLIPPSNANLLRPVPEWSLIGLNHTGYSRDHSLQAEAHRTFANGLGFQAFYTFVRALTTTDPAGFSDGNTSVNGGGGSGSLNGSGGETVPENIEILGEPNLSYKQRLKLVYFNNVTIPPHRFTFNAIYDLPFGRGKHFAGQVPKSLNYLIGGWQLATIGTWNSGPWMGVSTSLVQTGPVRIPASKRATFNIPGSSFRYRQWFAGDFDPSTATNVSGTPIAPAVMVPGPNCEGGYNGKLAVTLANGNCYDAPFGGFYNPDPRDNIIAPGAWNDDLSLYKHFKFGERFDMRFSADAFNTFNHPNDVPPAPDTGLQNLGQQANSSRVIQLSVRVEF
ncbi:MAG TPA: TonB-dependent receptor [Terriglobia bacterium]|nr:TonB-dependent receptor [Terriglobia bacterium]